MRIGSATLHVFIPQLFSIFCRTGVSVITARVLGPEGRGVYAVFISLVAMLGALLGFGMSQANVYHVSKGAAKPALLGNSLLFLAFTAAALGAGLWCWDRMLGQPGLSLTLPLSLLWVATLVLVLEHLLAAFLLGGLHFKPYRNILFVQAALNLGAATMLFAVTASETVAVELKVAADCLTVATLAALVWRVASIDHLRVDPALLLRQVTFGLQSHLATLINTSHYRVHLIILSTIAGDTAAGLFSVALLFIELVGLGPNAIGTVLLPKLSGMDDRREAARVTAIIVRMVVVISLAVAVMAWFPVAWVVGFFFGDEFRDAVVPARLILIGAALGTPVQILTRFFTSCARQGLTSAALGSAVAVAVTTSLLLIPFFGIFGAAMAFVASSATGTVLLITFFVRLTGTSFMECVLPTASDWELLKAGLVRLIGHLGLMKYPARRGVDEDP